MKKYSVILIIFFVILIFSNLIYNILTSFAGGFEARFQYIEIELENYKDNISKVIIYREGKESECTKVNSLEEGVNNVYVQNDNIIKFYAVHNAMYNYPPSDFVDTVKFEITNNNGEIVEHTFKFIFGESKYYFYKYDCEDGRLSEKEAIEENIPILESEKNGLIIKNIIFGIYMIINITFIIYLIFYIFKIIKYIKNKKDN